MAFRKGKEMALHWKGKEEAPMSMTHNAETEDVYGQKMKRKQAVTACNNTMGGIYLIDQHLPPFFHLLQLALWSPTSPTAKHRVTNLYSFYGIQMY